MRTDGQVTAQVVQQLGREDHPPLRSATAPPGNLPRSPTPLLGRADLLRSVTDALERSHLVTLVGPGGIGKTRLAIEVARTAGAGLTGGVWLVELADVASADDVARTVADLLESTDLPGRSMTESVVVALGARELILVLDNCEHVVEGAAELAEAIGARCPGVRMVATSREGLGVGSEQLVAVGPLDVTGAAVDLFTQRATSLDQSFDLVVWRSEVEDICGRLDGVPLAIELAAARIRSLSPADLLARLDDSFRLLGGGRRRSVERHRTLRATIQWSYELLTPPEQLAFRRLAIFTGSFDLAAAECVVASDALDDDLAFDDVGDLVGDLVERSMVVSEAGAHGRRFRLLEMMRQFGAEELAAAGDTDAMAARHAEFVASEIVEISELLGGRDEIVGAARLDELWPNVRAAFDWAVAQDDVDLALAIVGPLAPQSFVRRGMGEVSDWAERIVAMANPDDEETVARALLWCALHHIMTQDRERFLAIDARYGRPDHLLAQTARIGVADDSARTIDVGPVAAEKLRRLGEPQIAYLMEIFVGGAILGQGRLEEAEEFLRDLADRLRRNGPPTFLNWTLFMLGSIADFHGDIEVAQQVYDEVLAIPVPPQTNSANAVLEARAVFRSGDHVRSYELLRRFIDEELAVGNLGAAGLVSLEFINQAVATGRMEQAALLLGYLDQSGMLDVDGRGFKLLISESMAAVEADPVASTVRASVREVVATAQWALATIRGLLEELLHQHSTASTPRVDR